MFKCERGGYCVPTKIKGIENFYCRYCRYQACLKAGMNPNAVKCGDINSYSYKTQTSKVTEAQPVDLANLKVLNGAPLKLSRSESQNACGVCELTSPFLYFSWGAVTCMPCKSFFYRYGT